MEYLLLIPFTLTIIIYVKEEQKIKEEMKKCPGPSDRDR